MTTFRYANVDPKVCKDSALYGFIQYCCYPRKPTEKLERKLAARIETLHIKGFVEFDSNAQNLADVCVLTKAGADFLMEKDSNLRALFFNFLFGTIGTLVGAAISIITTLILR